MLLFRFRILCHKLCNHPYYCNVILLSILISSMMLAAEDPLFANIERNQASFVAVFCHYPRYYVLGFKGQKFKVTVLITAFFTLMSGA